MIKFAQSLLLLLNLFTTTAPAILVEDVSATL